MNGGGLQPGDERVPAADISTNVLSKQVVGNKSDAAVTTVGATASLAAYIKGILNILGAAGIDDVVIPIGPVGNAVAQSDVDSAVRYAVYLVNLAGNILTDAETTPGTFTVRRVRAGGDVGIISSTAATELNGVISAVVDFTTGSDWQEGDLGYIEFAGITATVGGITTEMPLMRKSFRVTQEVDIKDKIDVIDAFHDVPTADTSDNVVISDVVGNKTDAAVTVVDTSTSLLAYIKGLVDAGILVRGTFTTDSATVPADTSRSEADTYFDGSWIIPLTGNVADQPRQIASFANSGGVFTLDSEHPFSTTPGTVDYVIVGSGHNLVPGADSSANQTVDHVIGNKTDTVDYTPGATTSSLMRLLKGLLGVTVLAEGTLTTDSATVPADTSRSEATGFFDGDYLMTITGSVAFQPRQIVSFSSAGDVFTLDAENPFTATPGTVAYVILAGPDQLVPGTDVSSNQTPAHVVGNKADAAAQGGISATESLVAYLKEAVLGVGFDGVNAYTGEFNEFSVAGFLFGDHSTVSMLFIIPEAVGAINAHNSAILTELQKLGHVDTITQADALTYPHFEEYNVIVCGTDNGTAWTLSNLDHVKESPSSVICVDAGVANKLLIGTDGGDAATKTVLTAVSQIKANDLGLGVTGVTGLAAGANTISSSATYNTIDMSDADITETFYGTETTADNTDVLLAVVRKRQPDGTRGVLSDASEAPGDRWFYGPAYSASTLNTLGLAVMVLVGHMAIQVSAGAAGIEISGDIGDLETKIFGNQATEFNNGNPLVEYLTGRNSSGTRLAIGKSLYDIIGAAYVDAGGGLGTDSVLADLGLIHNLVDSAESVGPFSYLDAGAEQDVVTDEVTTRRRISLEFDLTTMTQNGTVRIYRKVDGSTYRVWTETTFTAADPENVFDAIFTTNQHWKLTYQEAVDEGAARSIPFNIITEVIE